ncbi:unnamed protein product [Taenia asiatica]|uniref:Uncharacterized protein n=1 Tax=Taenia asiatica TaxID=60517 RepID=A0A0R3W586_TAEAS|nr:unnamed protein product [Taenia asiatica]
MQSKFEVFPCGNHVEFQLATQIYAYGEKLPTTLTPETAHLNTSGTSVEFENVQVSGFLAKLLLRVNAMRSEREKRRALENVLLQQLENVGYFNTVFKIIGLVSDEC